MNCKYFEKCSAPLCHENPSSMQSARWYPGEEICRHRSVLTSNLKQLKDNVHTDHFFTADMLSSPMEELSDPAMKGIQADEADVPEAVKIWFLRYKGHQKPFRIDVF